MGNDPKMCTHACIHSKLHNMAMWWRPQKKNCQKLPLIVHTYYAYSIGITVSFTRCQNKERKMKEKKHYMRVLSLFSFCLFRHSFSTALKICARVFLFFGWQSNACSMQFLLWCKEQHIEWRTIIMFMHFKLHKYMFKLKHDLYFSV